MEKLTKKTNRGFVILFAVTVSAILLSIALGVTNIAQQEVKFNTSAKDTNNAFFAADTGIECAEINDKTNPNFFPPAGPAAKITCASSTANNITPVFTSATNSYDFVVSGLGGDGKSCAKVNIRKVVNADSSVATTITSKGYNVGDETCSSNDKNRVERELQVTYTAGSSSVVVPPSGIAFRSSAQASAASGILSLAISKPAGTTQNDVMIASVGVRPNTAVINAPSGWSLVRNIDNPASGGSSNDLATYYKVAGASEPASYTWIFNASPGSLGSAGGIMSFSGVNVSNPINVQNGQNTPATAMTSSTPSVTTTVPDTMVVTVHSIPSSPTWTPPAGMAEAVDVSSLTPFVDGGESVEMNYVLQPAAGSTGVKTATQNTSGGSPGLDYGNSQILVLQP